MLKPAIEEIADAINGKFPGAIETQETAFDFPVFIVKKSSIADIARLLHDDERFQFHFLTTACGIHYVGTERPFAMMYQLHSMVHNVRVRFKVYTSSEDLNFPSLTPVYSGANWMEREAYDFYGFKFTGHPDLKRILNVNDMDYFPMRKEYPVEDETRYDKDDTMFGREPAGYKKLI